MRVPVVSDWSTRQRVAAVVVVVGLVVVVVCLWAMNRRYDLMRRGGPAWLRSSQPPEYLGEPVASGDAWAAARPSHMSASSYGHGAGRRVIRTYPGSLMDEPSSLIPMPGSTVYGAGHAESGGRS